MSNETSTIFVIDAKNGINTVRDMTSEEYAQFLADQETVANLPDTQVLPNAD